MREIVIGKNDAGQRLDKFLVKAVKDMPFSLMYKSIRTKKIKLNRKRTEPNVILNEGDVLQLFLNEDIFGDGSEKDDAVSVLSHTTPIFDVEYEDENVMVVYKPEGLSVHSDEGNERNNLITQIQAYLYKKGEYDPLSEQSFAPALCNRIDRNTEGLVIAAKNAEALRSVDEMIRDGKITKKYLCAVHGVPKKKEDILYGWLKKDSRTNTVRVEDGEFPGSVKIKTGYRVIESKGNASLLEVRLYTGKTHQIRAHLAHIGHPLLGDGKYGQNREDRKLGLKSQALCSCSVRFECKSGLLSYLDGKEISVERGKIGFLRLFE
ncbi:MAG: RluA family pseudouridine synthase [Firmicutes bacterium]|nr:RluA family pseudouridine synthase [Candidatus Colimorpha enterica]